MESIIVGIIIIGIIIVPFVLLSRNNREKQNKILQELFSFAASNQCTIDQHALWINTSIGLDEKKHTIFFIKKNQELQNFQEINLAEMEKCRIINSARSINNKDGRITVVEKLELSFSNKDKNKKEKILEFYNDRLALTVELQLAEKWCKLCNDQISAIKQKKDNSVLNHQ